MMGQIGANDYSYWFKTGGPDKEIQDIIPQVIIYISHFIEELILLWCKSICVVPNIFPIGCWPSYLSKFHSDNPKDYGKHGCLKWLNEFSQKHNEALHWESNRLRTFHPGVKLI